MGIGLACLRAVEEAGPLPRSGATVPRACGGQEEGREMGGVARPELVRGGEEERAALMGAWIDDEHEQCCVDKGALRWGVLSIFY